MSKFKRLEQQLVPAITKRFGSDLVFLKWECDEVTENEIQYASTIEFVTAVFQSKTRVEKFPFTFKYQVRNDKIREWFKLDAQFYNEMYTYENILPLLNKNNMVEEIFPSYYFGACSGNTPDQDVIVLQDLRAEGFRTSSEIVYLDYEHCAVAMRTLGRYHALSYHAKQTKPGEFYEKVKGLRECRYREDMFQDIYFMHTVTARRAVQPFLERNEYVDIIGRYLEKLEDTNNYFLSLVEPEEPVAVICHGDFCRNNMLFRYGADGKPTDAKLFDIAITRYASPAIDLSFFLLLNTSPATRRLHWGQLLQVYHDSLASALPGTVVPSSQDILQEVRRKAIYAYSICAFFLPILLSEVPFSPETICDLSPKEKAEALATIGGQKGTDALADMFTDLVERGYID